MKTVKNIRPFAAALAVAALLVVAWFSGYAFFAPEARAHGCWGWGGYWHKAASDTAAHYPGCPCPMCARSAGLVTAEIEASDPSAALYAAKCGACHAVPSPTGHTPKEWPAVVSRMEGHMAHHSSMMGMGGLGLTDAEREKILEYLGEGAK